MKARFMFLILSLISLVSSQLSSQIIHTNSELGKVCETTDGKNVIISQRGENILMSKMDKKGNFDYHESIFKHPYSMNAKIVDSKISTGEEGYTLYYKANGKEYLSQFKDEGKGYDKNKIDTFDTYNVITSALTLKNGKVFLAGIREPSADFAQTTLNINIYDPVSKTVLSGESLNAFNKFISCAELKDNEVYCAYVHDEKDLRSLLRVQHFKISDEGTITQDPHYLVKSFYTTFNYIKVIKISQNRMGILFQTGNTKYTDSIPYGNTGKDLYFYDLQVTPSTFEVIRYDYIFNNCRYKQNAEDYTIDLIATAENIVYAICEIDNAGKDAVAFQLMKIYGPDKKFLQTTLSNWEEKNVKAVKNPSLVKIDNSIGIVYTRVNSTDGKDVMLLLMNYPNCQDAAEDLKIYSECKNELKVNSLASYFKIFLSNPNPGMASTPLYYRIVNANDMKIYNGNTEIVPNKDYPASTISSLTLKEYGSEETYIEYVVTRKESDEVIFGKTCKIKVDFPECLPQCKGCDENGNEKDNRCFDCQPGFYSVPTKDDKTGCAKDGKLHNCNRCDVACTSCYGPFNHEKPTTNCIENQCNRTLNYFPYDKDETICINEQNKTFWEENLKCVLFLDKTKGDNKEVWKWSCCYETCGSCHLPGTKQQHNCDTCKRDVTYFYQNQTEENKLIPGNCNPSCEGDGCYKCEVGIHLKMCDCLPHCEKCQNAETCEVCRPEWLLQPAKTSCNQSCEYCLSPIWEDKDKKKNGRCINCKTYFTPEQYTYRNECYAEADIPSFTYREYRSENDFYDVKKKYHVYDEKCNMLTACKKGCHTCFKEQTDKCTECEEDYYMDDPFNRTNRKWFRCFTKRQCRGNDEYPHDYTARIGGVDIIENDKKVCLNCKQRNNTFRQPEDDYWCGDNITGTFVDIPDWNKLTKCYFRCKSCDARGHPCAMECLSCRDSKYYDLIRYNRDHGNCYRKQHKCGIYPYYHNYDLAIDEDDCGEDCDVCLYNFQCPKELPFFKFETHECVEFCPFTEVFGGQCNANTSIAAIILLRNPFGLRHPYDFINNTVTLNQIFQSSLFQYFASSYDIDITTIQNQINNYIGTGKVYNLPQSQVIIGNNISIELSSVRLELEKLLNISKGITPKTPTIPIPGENGTKDNSTEVETTAINLTECQNILKKKYQLPEEEDLLVIKSDTLEILNMTEYFGIETDYQLFSTSLGAFLPLSSCKDAGSIVEVSNPFRATEQLINQYQSKTASVLSNGYDVFDANSPFYNDVCTPYTNEHGNDVLLDARRKDYYNENINICEKGCAFIGYNTKSMTYTCRCNTKAVPGEEAGEYQGEIIERSMPKNFKDLISRRSNIAVFKCATNVFSAEGQKNNFGSYILLASFASFIGVLVFHFVKERDRSMEEAYKELGHIANPPKGDKKDEKNEKKVKKDKKNKGNDEKVDGKAEGKTSKVRMSKLPAGNKEKDATYSGEDYLFLPYSLVYAKDALSYLMTFWNFLKFKQIIIFTFFTRSKGILRSTKVALFILFIAFYMAFTALFFNDSIMRALYIYKGNANAAVHIPNIILSSICSFIAGLIVRYVCLNERDISKVLMENHPKDREEMANKVKKSSKIKLLILYAVSGVLILLCWYYVSAFCAVFKNSQKNYVINFFICFLVCNLWPFVTCWIPTIMRRKALDNNNECLYKASQIVSIF